MRYLSLIKIVVSVLLSIGFATYLIFQQGRPEPVAKIVTTFGLASNNPIICNLGSIYFPDATSLNTLYLKNDTNQDIDLKLISKSCGCINVPEALKAAVGETVPISMRITNYARKHGKQRIQLSYATNKLDRVVTIEIDYNSLVPVHCETSTFYPDIGKAGVADVILESSLHMDLEIPKLSDKSYSVVSFKNISERDRKQYLLQLSYPAIHSSGECHLHFTFANAEYNTTIPVAFIAMDKYVIRNLTSSKQSASAIRTIADIIVQRYDSKAFAITKVDVPSGIEATYVKAVAKVKHVIQLQPNSSWDTERSSSLLTIETDMTDQSQTKYTFYIHKP